MRQAMADYVRAVHESYLAQAQLQPPAIRGRMALLDGEFTVVAAGVENLHVIGTRERLPAPGGQEVEIEEELRGLRWKLRFYDPVVLPSLGLIDESGGAAGDRVRRAIGLSTHLYHVIVRPGSELTAHHAGHAGSGLANAHAAEARDFEAIRAHARGRERWVDEMEGAALAGLVHAQILLAREIAPSDETVRALDDRSTPAQVRKTVLAAVRGDGRHA